MIPESGRSHGTILHPDLEILQGCLVLFAENIMLPFGCILAFESCLQLGLSCLIVLLHFEHLHAPLEFSMGGVLMMPHLPGIGHGWPGNALLKYNRVALSVLMLAV